MTKEDAIKILYEMEYKTAYSGELGGLAVEMAVEALRHQPSLPSNLNEAAINRMHAPDMYLSDATIEEIGDALLKMAYFGAEWMAGQGWIDDGRMPTEKKEESDTLQGHHEWTASEPVLAWDSMYGPRIDFTRNGKWVSETKGGYTGQVCHGIVAWMPIPQYKQ